MGAEARPVARPNVYKSPAELLDLLSPPKCKFYLNHNDHWWGSVWKHESEKWIDKLARKHHNKVFDASNPGDVWAQLREVHDRAWLKYDLAKDELPACEPQPPGQIPDFVLEGLKPAIQGLPEAETYAKK